MLGLGPAAAAVVAAMSQPADYVPVPVATSVQRAEAPEYFMAVTEGDSSTRRVEVPEQREITVAMPTSAASAFGEVETTLAKLSEGLPSASAVLGQVETYVTKLGNSVRAVTPFTSGAEPPAASGEQVPQWVLPAAVAVSAIYVLVVLCTIYVCCCREEHACRKRKPIRAPRPESPELPVISRPLEVRDDGLPVAGPVIICDVGPEQPAGCCDREAAEECEVQRRKDLARRLYYENRLPAADERRARARQ